MSDDLVKRHIEQLRLTGGDLADLCQPIADAIDALTAERDRLREALQQFLIEYDEVDLANAEPSSLTAAVLSARAALKGESHD